MNVSRLRTAADRFLDYIFPPKCMVCLTVLPINGPRWLCGECSGLLLPIEKAACIKCGVPVDNEHITCHDCTGGRRNAFLSRNFAVYEYDDIVKRIVHNLKYGKHMEIARGLVACANEYRGLGPIIDTGADFLTYAPIHRKRSISRGFNQAELLALEISKITGVPVYSLLKRTRDTAPQSRLGYEARINNMAGAIAFNGSKDISGKTVMIIDDIFTTGSTLNTCAGVLLNNGAKKVYGFTLAVAVKEIEK